MSSRLFLQRRVQNPPGCVPSSLRGMAGAGKTAQQGLNGPSESLALVCPFSSLAFRRHPSRDRVCRLVEHMQEMVRMGLAGLKLCAEPRPFLAATPAPQKKTTAAQSSCAAETGWPSGLKCQNVKNNNRDFPGGPVVNTVCFHCGVISIPGWEPRSHILHSMPKKPKKCY